MNNITVTLDMHLAQHAKTQSNISNYIHGKNV